MLFRSPSVSQIGGNPILISDTSLSAVDRFTGVPISFNRSGLDTKLTSDPGAHPGDDIVLK